ncbi:MAG: hypothetical protein QNJ46_29115 [Leptolyngbyaceae cyanobacterium MO_188.B28]|nr:hypothetical protein [Leptolyngbyaceae cyanobacterium MO_188.B28]
MLNSFTTDSTLSSVSLYWQMFQTSRGTVVKIWEPKTGEHPYCWKQSVTFGSHNEAEIFLQETAKVNAASLEEISYAPNYAT